MSNYRQTAVDLAKQAGDIMRKNFQVGMQKEWKDDDSPVTATDKEINRIVIETIEKEFPDHSILGEEEKVLKDSDNVWVCDPIDGTIPFSHGYPTFCFSLGLVRDGESILGVIYDPIMDRLLVGEKGMGATMNGKAIRVNQKENVDARTVINSHLSSILPLLSAQGSFGICLHSSVYASMLVAIGEIQAEIYGYTKPWDIAAAKVIVEEAGGKVTDIHGNDQRYDGEIKPTIISNRLIHAELLQIISEIPEIGSWR